MTMMNKYSVLYWAAIRSVGYTTQQNIPTCFILHTEPARRNINVLIVHTATTQTDAMR